jgi:L-ascorbate metabolism protein UlaG (beta-lactamase superfamily)
MVTHAAGDHVGQTFEILENSKAILVCDVATRHLALEKGIPADRIYYMLSGVEYTLKDITVKALPAKHISLVKLESGFVNGQPLSYVIKTSSGEKLFFGGDTSIHSDFKLYGELYGPQFAILGVGGVDIHGQSLIELHADEAALAAKWLGVRKAVPIHYRFDEGERFIDALKKTAPEVEGLLMKPGDRFTFEPDA